MSRKPWLKFYPTDWRNEKTLKLVSRAARSLWLDLIGLIHEGDDGRLHVAGQNPSHKDLASILGDDPRTIKTLMAELEQAGVFDRDQEGFVVSRRMIRDRVKADLAAKHGRLGGNPALVSAKNEQEGVNPHPSPRGYMPEAICQSVNHSLPTKTKPQNGGELPLDDHENFAFEGDHMRVTHREFEALRHAYPDLNTMGTIRAADQRYPRRMNKAMTPRAYLESVFTFKDEELRGMRAERRAEQAPEGSPDPHANSFIHCRDKRLWWRQEGARHLRMGIWNDHLWGAKPWRERTECPVGTFSAEELQELRDAFEAELARKVAEEERQDAEIAKGGSGRGPDRAGQILGRRSQSPVPAV